MDEKCLKDIAKRIDRVLREPVKLGKDQTMKASRKNFA